MTSMFAAPCKTNTTELLPGPTAALGTPISYTPGMFTGSTATKPPDDQVPSVPGVRETAVLDTSPARQ
jgi:hypothetical protein